MIIHIPTEWTYAFMCTSNKQFSIVCFYVRVRTVTNDWLVMYKGLTVYILLKLTYYFQAVIYVSCVMFIIQMTDNENAIVCRVIKAVHLYFGHTMETCFVLLSPAIARRLCFHPVCLFVCLLITRDSEVIMISPCVFVCVCVSVCLCLSRWLSGRFNYEGLVPHK